MSSVTSNPVVDSIGEMAGVVWHTLQKDGPMSFAKLVRTVGAPRDSVHQAVGWLARENKLRIDERSRGRLVMVSDQ
jgi:Winged helix-turn-helix domain (DUF2582)